MRFCSYIFTFLLSVIILTAPLIVNAQAISKKTADSRWRTSFELIPIDADEDMGLLGIHYDIFPFYECANCYMGIGGYSGASGEEGGFFTAGLTAGWLYELSTNLKTDVGIHIGGGGGSDATYPGGGLIVRSHLGLQYFENYGFNFGVANINFPNTTKQNNSDTHFYFGLTLPDSIWIGSGSNSAAPFAGSRTGFRVSPAFLLYRPTQIPITKAGTFTAGTRNDDIPLMGIQLSWHNGQLFFPLELYGAAGGGVDGYASIFSGVGYVTPVINDLLLLEGKALLGVGGDGRLDTGGGALAHPMLGLRAQIDRNWSVATFLGKVYGLDGKFEATSAELSVSWSADRPKSGQNTTAIFDDTIFDFTKWHGSLANKIYFPKSNIRQTDGEQFDRELHLFGVEMERPFTNYISAVGNTYWAHTGNIGSYAEGGLGVKVKSQTKKIDLFALGLLSVAGGGDIEVDKGFLISAEIGIGYKIDNNLFIDLSAGYTQSSEKSFQAEVATIKLRWATDTVFYK